MPKLKKLKYRWDVFLSYNRKDKTLINKLASQLMDKTNLKPFLDKWHLVPGDPWQEAIEKALDNSAACAVFLGPSGLGPWENEEMRSALDERVRNKTFRVIPVLLPGANPKDPNTLPLFLRRLTWVDFRSGIDDTEAFHRLIAGIRGKAPGPDFIEIEHKPKYKPMIVHALPPAPSFVGRIRELSELNNYWDSGWTGVISLIGLGGAGKTAIVERMISGLLTGKGNPPDGLFVWSFYMDQDVGSFLSEAYRYFSGEQEVITSNSGAFHLLIDCLTNGGRFLIVMDGLERVQRTHSDAEGMFGEMDDMLLRQVVSRLALGAGETLCLITSRFPVSDLHPWRGKGYETININQLEHNDARTLFRLHNIKGSNAALDRIINEYGRHALTLDYLATYLAEFCDGNAENLELLEEPAIDSDISEERKLARVFHAYEKVLTDKELALLTRICIFRFSTAFDALYKIFRKEGVGKTPGILSGLVRADLKRIVHRLVNLHLIQKENEKRYTVHPAVRDHFYQLLTKKAKLHSHRTVLGYFSGLAEAPSEKLPEDKETLDLLEELIYQAIQAGKIKEAKDIYNSRLGGVNHLGFKLGEFSRALRILNLFPECPNHSDMAYYLFNFGDLEGAKRHFPRAGQIVDGIMMFQGLLPKAKEVGKGYPTRYGTVDFLMGTSREIPDSDQWVEDLPYIPAELYLWLDELDHAEDRLKRTKQLWKENEWNDLLPRCDLIMAEIMARRGRFDEALKIIKQAILQILKNGTASWICQYYLYNARFHRNRKDFKKAQNSLQEGLHFTEQCGFTLYYIDLLIEQGYLYLQLGESKEAKTVILSAMNGILKHSREPANHFDLPFEQLAMIGAKHKECQYAWGTARAGYLLGEALLIEGSNQEALSILRETLNLQERIGDPKENQTKLLLKSIKI